MFSPLPSVAKDKNVLALSSAELIDKTQDDDVPSNVVLGDSGVDFDLPDVEEDDAACPTTAVVKERLQNSKMLSKLDDCFPHLSKYQQEDVVRLIKSHMSLYNDVPSRTYVLTHAIDIG